MSTIKKDKKILTIKMICYCALFAAMSVVLSRFLGYAPIKDMRFSLESVPVFLSGMLFGPLPGALVGFSADFIGCLFSPYGYNPIFSVPPILYGLVAGLFRMFVCKKPNIIKIGIAFLPPVVLGSIVYQSFALAIMYSEEGAFAAYLLAKLGTRGIQFAITWIVETVLVFLLVKSHLFEKLGVWPVKKPKTEKKTIEETLAYIHNVKWMKSKPGLSRTRELLAKLGNPEKKLKFVHVAGTDGKGSTSSYIASVLQKAGYVTGLYTSPYIIKFNERMQINGQMIEDDELIELTEIIRPIADSMKDTPTEFEMITALGMLWFYRKKCDIVVLEVGMGGELDSTNVIDTPEVAVLTSMGFDHTAFLGPTMTDIAGAKAGIIKENGLVASYGSNEEADAVFEKKCREKNCELHVCDFGRLDVLSTDLSGSTFNYRDYRDVRISLAGSFQPRNASLAIEAIELLRKKGYRITDENIYDGLKSVYWPGRFEVLMNSPTFILDGAHNPHGMEAAVQSLKAVGNGKKYVIIMGVMADKEVDAMVKLLLPVSSKFFTVRPDNPRAMEAGALAELIRQCGGEAESAESTDDAVKKAVEFAGEEGMVSAIGSLYFSSDVRKSVTKIYPEKILRR